MISNRISLVHLPILCLELVIDMVSAEIDIKEYNLLVYAI